MINKLNISSRNAILISGFLLGGYLLLMITVTNVGQNRLKESQINELHLKVNSYAESLSYFFDTAKDNLNNISAHKTTYTFFANLASGMSMEYGLGSSLFQLRQNLVNYTRSTPKNHSVALFERMALVGFESEVIADSSPRLPFDVSSIPFAKMKESDNKIHVSMQRGKMVVKILKNVYYNGELVAIIVGQVNNDVLTRLLTAQEYESSESRLDISSSDGTLHIWNTFGSHKSHIYDDSKDSLYFEERVEGTPFFLHAWFEPVSERQMITSSWFIAALSFFAVPVVLGLYYAMRTSNANLILVTKIAENNRQQAKLATQNDKLKTEVQRRKVSEERLAYQATHDALTRLSNRKSGDEQLQHAIYKAKRTNHNVLVMFIDLDNFKQINDTLGHPAGDFILKQTAERLTKAVRKSDIVARIGGDEFLLIIPDLSSQKEAQLLASKLLHIFEQPFLLQQTEFFVSTSIGMSVFPKDGTTADDLMAHADTAMYRVKEQGRNGFSFYDASMNQDVQRNLDIDARLRQAMGADQLDLYYQPIIDLSNDQIVGAEALLRWNDPKLGFVPPDEFIPIAERNGLIHKLGEFALTQACHQAAQWQAIQPLSIAVNFSCVQFRQHDLLLQQIESALQNSGLAANLLDIEITESLLFNHNAETVMLLNQLKEMGTQLSIDDFGTGYSALSYLQKFPFSKLKIDRTFLHDMETNPSSQELVNAIVAMAKALGLKVVAEGVESQWDRDYLKQQNCEFAQGYHYSRPVPAAEFELLLQEQKNVA